jgi:DNA-binding HxlR family transcriptional regulator
MPFQRFEQYNTLWENCPSREVLSMIADKWTVMVIYALSKGTARHSELLRSITGISQKMLTQTLRQLEASGLVERKVYPVVPPKVEYSLTPLGESLLEPVTALKEWAESHMEEIIVAQEHFEAALAP